MRILIYGAGCIGSLYAALLARSGQHVSILARGRRLQEIHEHGIRLEGQPDVPVQAVEHLAPDDAYDLVLVVLPKHRVADVLPDLAANRATPNVMFLGNNAAGPAAIVEALGRDRVLLGFPGAAAVFRESGLAFLILREREQPTTIGELDGAKSDRIEAIASALRAAGFPVAISERMDAWLKTHAAEIVPTALALYAAGGDAQRLANTRDAQLLMVRAIREGYRVLDAKEIPVTPANHRLFNWLPEWVLLPLMRKMLTSTDAAIKIGHATNAREEMETLAGELRELAQGTGVTTLRFDELCGMDEPLPAGSTAITVHWGTLGITFAVAFAGALFAAALLWPAGRLDWAQGWIFVGLIVGFTGICWACMQRWNPELVEARMRIGKGTKKWDKVWGALFFPTMFAIYVVAGVEARDGSGSLPVWSWWPGLAVFLVGSALLLWPMLVNPFFEKTVRIQTDRGHRVIDTGPYAIVRHPGYVGFALWMVATPMLLGSAWSAIPTALAVAGIVIRTALEDRTLHAELAGYREYAQRVRYRLVPGVW